MRRTHRGTTCLALVPSRSVREPDGLAGSAVDLGAATLRSVRAGGDTKTRRSRRALAKPERRADALSALWDTRTRAHDHRAECDCSAAGEEDPA